MDHPARRSRGIHSLPGNLWDALDSFAEDRVLTDAMGEHVTNQYIAGKRREWDEYRTRVSNWEIARYLVTY